MSFSFFIRTQFTFYTQDRTLSCILSGISGAHVNITGFVQSKKSNRLNLVRLVAGSADVESANDLRIVRKVLASSGVKLHEAKVCQIRKITPGVPGALKAIFGALWCKVKVIAMYAGESNRIFVYVSDLNKAIRTLSQINVHQYKKKCRRSG
ncbi:hypothetical protein SAMN04487897_101900 [Paenibacillus sp. yr247]|uniref:hypothetical protein n=1 Tax=Paenibacillus sp. yr247 TaxID=1761880 RepID=UPI00088D2FFD|nr:hypothetical protein [Paenibacillus sp. yr247]SDN04677.1 hypothetical protein SAMN04487897_101900 [Paenibacillus sp. yr247]